MFHLNWLHHKETQPQPSHPPSASQAKRPPPATEPEEYSEPWFDVRYIKIAEFNRSYGWREEFKKDLDEINAALKKLQATVSKFNQVKKGGLEYQQSEGSSLAQELRDSKLRWNSAQKLLRTFYERHRLKVSVDFDPWKYGKPKPAVLW